MKNLNKTVKITIGFEEFTTLIKSVTTYKKNTYLNYFIECLWEYYTTYKIVIISIKNWVNNILQETYDNFYTDLYDLIEEYSLQEYMIITTDTGEIRKYKKGDLNYDILYQETIENIENYCNIKIFEDSNGNYLKID